MSRDVPPPVCFRAMPTIVATAPTRIDFGGGWTDVPPYPEEQGGRVCNVAITRYAEVRLEPAARTHVDAVSIGADGRLAAAAFKRSGVSDARPTIRSDFPTGAGLGGSSAVGVALAAALQCWRNLPIDDRAALAESSRAVEVEDAGIAGGRQDHYAAAFGGALNLEFGTTTSVQMIPLSEAQRVALAERCVVAYTGQSRISGETITAVLAAYADRTRSVMDALRSMRDLAGDMARLLAAGDLDGLGEALARHWVHQRALHPAITTDRIESVLRAATQAGALGGKALGASGGGCVAVMARRGQEAAVVEAIAPLARVLPWSVDTEGVRVRIDE